MLRRIAASLAAVALCAGCVARVDLDVTGASVAPPTPVDPLDPVDDGPIDVVPAPARLRLLSAVEYRNTVRDLLGLEASAELRFADWTTGFDSGAGAQLDENLLSRLYVEAERLAVRYVRERAPIAFSCLNPGAVSRACVARIVDELGPRSQRRPLDAALREELLAGFDAMVGEDDPVPVAACDVDSQPAPHFAVVDGRCRPSCGVLGGGCSSAAAGCAEGSGPLGISHDCELCCGAGGAFVDEPRLQALEQLVLRLLLSPRFLYRSEVGRQDGALDPFERASLLSYALTASMPDDALYADAAAGALDDDAVARHVSRLLTSERGQVRMAEVVQQWARAAELDAMALDPAAYPKLDGGAPQAQAMRDEVHTFTRAALFGAGGDAGTLRALLSSSTAFINRDNAALYGLVSDSDVLVPTDVDPQQRAGLLTLPGVMAAHAWRDNVDNDRPVKRGLLVLNQLLCGELRLPANFVPGVPDPNAVDNFEFLTTRDQFEAMMQQNDSCRTCHSQFMPYGYAFGSYDGLGRFRTHQRGLPIDASVDGVMFDGVTHRFDGAPDMMRALATSPTVAKCFAKRFVTYALGTAAVVDAEGHVDSRHVDTLAAAVAHAVRERPDHVEAIVAALFAEPTTFVRSAP